MSVAVLADICIICGISQISFTKETAVIEKAGCIPATYPDASTITPMANLSTFLPGDVDLALVYAYILPLSAWWLEFMASGESNAFLFGKRRRSGLRN